jgi:hypothetical protein
MKVCISSRVRCHRGRYPSPEYALVGRLKLLQCEFPVSISKLLSKDETRTDPLRPISSELFSFHSTHVDAPGVLAAAMAKSESEPLLR